MNKIKDFMTHNNKNKDWNNIFLIIKKMITALKKVYHQYSVYSNIMTIN